MVGTVNDQYGHGSRSKNQGYELVRAKVGDRYVVEELLKRDWLIGGETSGHILCLDKHTTGDGIIAALQVLAGVVVLKQSLEQVVDWADYPQTMINIRLTNKSFDWQNAAKYRLYLKLKTL